MANSDGKASEALNDAALREMLREHVCYEVDMLIRTFALLETGVPDQRLANALIESFSVHARNLCDFFNQRTPRTPRTDAKSADFVTDSYVNFANGAPREDLTGKSQEDCAY